MQLHLSGKTMDAISIERLQYHEPPEGYWLAFSGGKDSVVILDLAKRAGVKFEAHYNLTTVDPPELVRFIRTFPDVHIDRPEQTMWQLILAPRCGLMPTRYRRWCCRELKERGGIGRLVVTGIRWAESARRSQRRLVETCHAHASKLFLHPIIDWETSDVWSYIHSNELSYCNLYDEGFHRLGCVMCPAKSANDRARDMLRWPKLATAWKRACYKLWELKPQFHKYHPTPEHMWQWWIKGAGSVDKPGEPTLFD